MVAPAFVGWLAALTLVIGGCAGGLSTSTSATGSEASEARARLVDAGGGLVAEARLRPAEGGVAIELEIYDLPPGERAFHIHERGRCEAPDFKSAGGHFNPFGSGHGLEDEAQPHLGDLTNLVVGQDGTATHRWLAEGVTLAAEGERSLFAGEGTALVIHEGPDDYRSEPSGNAGPRIACGVIEP